MSLTRKSKFVLPLMGACLAANVSAADLGKVGDTAVSLKGFVKFDAVYSDFEYGANDGGGTRDFYVPNTIPVEGTGGSVTSLDLHARQSRVGLQTVTDKDGNSLKTYVEFDFYGALTNSGELITNNYGLDVRHAFFTYNKWLFGQTWTTFMDTSVLPDGLDFIGNTDAMPFVRQAQARYTSGAFQFALENAETKVWGGPTNDDNDLPDIVGKYSLSSGDLSMSISAVLRQLVSGEESTNGFGLSVAGKYLIGSDDVRFLVTTGSGVGRYIGLGIAADAFVNADGELETVDTTSYYVGYRHVWNDKWRSTLSYSAIDIDDTGSNNADWATSSNSLRLNLLTSPMAGLTFGGEVTLAEREVQTGATGELTRLQFSATLAF